MFLYDLIYHHGYGGIFFPNYRKYTISYLSILFNNSALQFWRIVHLKLLRTLLVSQFTSECHFGIYIGLHCTGDIETLSTQVACPSSLITLEDPGLEIQASLFCSLPGWNNSLCREQVVSLKTIHQTFQKKSNFIWADQFNVTS
jgi:hypothetical protein